MNLQNLMSEKLIFISKQIFLFFEFFHRFYIQKKRISLPRLSPFLPIKTVCEDKNRNELFCIIKGGGGEDRGGLIFPSFLDWIRHHKYSKKYFKVCEKIISTGGNRTFAFIFVENFTASISSALFPTIFAVDH